MLSAQIGLFNELLLIVLFTGGSIILTTTYSYAQPLETQPLETQPLETQPLETQPAENAFQTIVTLFDVDPNTGDVITFVNSENITKWKIFSPFSELKTGNTAEVSFTISGNNIGAGDVFKACVLMIKDISIVCKAGENSVAERPEIVDISLVSAELIKANPSSPTNQPSSPVQTESEESPSVTTIIQDEEEDTDEEEDEPEENGNN